MQSKSSLLRSIAGHSQTVCQALNKIVFDMLTFSGIGTLLGLGFVKLKGLGSETDYMIGLCY